MDPVVRCFGTGNELYEAYHDQEWARPVPDSPDEAPLFERICLEGFQSGLSWLTILRKRPAFRAAFAGFAPQTVAVFGRTDVQRLLGDAGIVRNRAKIEAAISNAQALVELHDRGERLTDLVHQHAPAVRVRRARSFGEVPARTPESAALSAALKRRGFRFVGPTTMYALMQAIGVVDDHLAECWLGLPVDRT